MNKVTFNRVKQQSLPNLYVASKDGVDVGFIYKPTDSKSDKNAWRCYVGIGDSAKFLHHTWKKDVAMMGVVLAVNNNLK